MFFKVLTLAICPFIFNFCSNNFNQTITSERNFYIRGIIINGSPLFLSIIEFDEPSKFDFNGTTDNYSIPGWGSGISSGFVEVHDLTNDSVFRDFYPFKSRAICPNLVGKHGSSYFIKIKLDSFIANFQVSIPDSFNVTNWYLNKENDDEGDVKINCQFPPSYSRDSVFLYHNQGIVKSNYVAAKSYEQVNLYIPFHLIPESNLVSYNQIKPDFFNNWYPHLDIYKSAPLYIYVFPKRDILNAMRIDETINSNKNPFEIHSNPKVKVSENIYGTIVGTYKKHIKVKI